MEECSRPTTAAAGNRPGRRRAGGLPNGLVIRKYGGSSLATPEHVRTAAGALAALAAEGREVVAVVSAMGETTDELVALAGGFAERPEPREVDQLLATGGQATAALLALAVNQLGVPAGSLSGDQAGIVVGGRPGAGVVEWVDTHRVRERLRRWRVVVVAGSQGRTRDGELLTLGRGGADTTAVALAAAFGSTDCEIRTDVPGGHAPGAGPRPGSTARRPVRVRVLHSVWPAHGTAPDPLSEGHRVVGVAHERDVRLVSLTLAGDRPVRCAPALAGLVEHGLHPDVLTWRDCHEVRFTVGGRTPVDVIGEVARELGARWAVEDGLGAVSVVGVGLFDHSGYLAGTLRAVGGLGAAVAALTTSPSRFTAVLPADLVDAAVLALHETFGLGLPAAGVGG